MSDIFYMKIVTSDLKQVPVDAVSVSISAVSVSCVGQNNIPLYRSPFFSSLR